MKRRRKVSGSSDEKQEAKEEIVEPSCEVLPTAVTTTSSSSSACATVSTVSIIPTASGVPRVIRTTPTSQGIPSSNRHAREASLAARENEEPRKIPNAFVLPVEYASEEAFWQRGTPRNRQTPKCLMREANVCQCRVCVPYEATHRDDGRLFYYTHRCHTCNMEFRCLPTIRRVTEIPNKNVACRCIVYYFPQNSQPARYFCGNLCYYRSHMG